MSNMTYYQTKLDGLKKSIYKNQAQINAVIAVRNYINENYERDLNLDLLSKIQLVSKYHLLRLFKRKMIAKKFILLKFLIK